MGVRSALASRGTVMDHYVRIDVSLEQSSVCVALLHGSGRWRLAPVRSSRASPFLTRDACLAIQAEPGSPPPYPEAEAQGLDLARVNAVRSPITGSRSRQTQKAVWRRDQGILRRGASARGKLAAVRASKVAGSLHLRFFNVLPSCSINKPDCASMSWRPPSSKDVRISRE